MSLNSGQIRPLTWELAALERLNSNQEKDGTSTPPKVNSFDV